MPEIFLKFLILEPPFLIASNKIFFELKIIFLQSFSLIKHAFLLGFILLKNKFHLHKYFQFQKQNFDQVKNFLYFFLFF